MKKLFLVVFLCTAFLFMGNSAMAYPTLQLDIDGGTYDGNTTIIDGTSGSFDLYALLNSSSTSGIYYISAAIVPSTGTYSGPDPLLNSISGGGLTPSSPNPDTGTVRPTSLPWHGPFPTYYWEYEFEFDGSEQTAPYDAQTYSGTDIPSGTGFYAAIFNFDVSGVLDVPGVDAVHFDFYTYSNLPGGKPIEFAPFSHDASAVPEPATLLLLGGGLVGLAGFGRKKFKK